MGLNNVKRPDLAVKYVHTLLISLTTGQNKLNRGEDFRFILFFFTNT